MSNSIMEAIAKFRQEMKAIAGEEFVKEIRLSPEGFDYFLQECNQMHRMSFNKPSDCNDPVFYGIKVNVSRE